MLPLKVIEEIRQLVAEGRLSQRRIAEQLKVSRGTVWAISSGRRGIHGLESGSGASWLPHIEVSAERCRSCGGLVLKPCLLCQTRAYRQRMKHLTDLSMAEVGSQKRVA